MFLFSSSLQTKFSYTGFSLGVIFACIIGYLIFVQGRRFHLKPFFSVTTFFLVLFSAGMTAYGCHEMEEFLVKGKHLKKEIKRPWSILEPKDELNQEENSFMYNYNEKIKQYIHILHDKGSIGVFLKGFFGYNSNPNWIELFAWITILILGLTIWTNFYFKT